MVYYLNKFQVCTTITNIVLETFFKKIMTSPVLVNQVENGWVNYFFFGFFFQNNWVYMIGKKYIASWTGKMIKTNTV